MRGLIAALLLIIAAPAAMAGTYPVDDSASTVLAPVVNMKWDDAVPRPGQRATVSGRLGVIVRLDVAQWKGKVGKIYMKLPPQSIGSVYTTWTTRGRLLPGALRDGERSLVYAGPIHDSMIEDTISLLIQADGNRLFKTEQLHFSFEIDTQP
jgi:hypothetical protein